MGEDVVVAADWVADRLRSVTVVDVREPWEYEGIGHLPGAVNIPFEAFRADESGPAGMLPPAEAWASLLGEAGIAPDDDLVVYDDMHGVFAARFVVTAILYGHGGIHLLDGDYSAWVQTHEGSTDAVTVAEASYPVPALDRGPLVTAEAVTAAATDDGAVLVDTRSAEEFAAGHIAGAVQLDWIDLVDETSRGLKPVAALESLLADRGITRDKRVVLYCNTARRLSHTYLVLRWLGFEDVGFYEGSLTAWNAEDRPIVEE